MELIVVNTITTHATELLWFRDSGTDRATTREAASLREQLDLEIYRSKKGR